MAFKPKKPPVYLPLIAEPDYDSFRRILGPQIRETYDQWLDLVAQWKNHHKSDDVRHIEVEPREFSQHLTATSRAPTLNELMIFAENRGKLTDAE